MPGITDHGRLRCIAEGQRYGFPQRYAVPGSVLWGG